MTENYCTWCSARIYRNGLTVGPNGVTKFIWGSDSQVRECPESSSGHEPLQIEGMGNRD